MRALLALLPVALLAAASLYAAVRGTDVFSSLTEGGRKGLSVMVGILPSLVTLLPAVYMLRASGALDAFGALLSPLLRLFRIPPELTPLMLLRPFSGSGALALGSELMSTCGVDSPVGRCAAVLLGSTETTFYVLAVYFGAAGVKKSRHAVPAALCADLTAFFAAVWATRAFFGG